MKSFSRIFFSSIFLYKCKETVNNNVYSNLQIKILQIIKINIQ